MFLNESTYFYKKPLRIVSLVPSQSELLYALGLEANVVGITKFCIHPAHWINTKKIIGGTKQLNIDAIRALEPDLIIANKEENSKEQVEILAADFPVYVTDVCNLTDALLMIKNIGIITHTVTSANLLNEKIEQAFASLSKLNSVNTAYLIWRNPYMTVGYDSFIHDMLIRCGFINIFADTERYPHITIDEIKARDCKLLLLSSEPYPFQEKHISELKQALPNCSIRLVDGEFFSWYGSKLIHAPAYFNLVINGLSAAIPE
ncbi:MAG: helical backbone metal receptor [Ferruginibacter sp.]